VASSEKVAHHPKRQERTVRQYNGVRSTLAHHMLEQLKTVSRFLHDAAEVLILPNCCAHRQRTHLERVGVVCSTIEFAAS
jgi:hypothetical protein